MNPSPDLRIVQPKSLTEIVVDRLREAIVEGQFALGENVSEDRLAEMFGVSRTPVREALMHLQQTGLVIVRPKRGSFVFSPTFADVAELCEYRLLLEWSAVEMALRRDRGGLLAALDAQIEAMRRAQETRDLRAYARADTAFHKCFFDFCGNRLVQDAFRLAEGRIATLRTAVTAPDDARRDASFEQHVEMVALIRADRMAELHALVARHVDWTDRKAMFTAGLAALPRSEGR